MPLYTFELRNYLIQPERRERFIDYFEGHFIFSQQDVGMHVLGQFRVIGAADRFVWLRGFANMATRLAGLQAFYNGPVWQQYGPGANEMIIDSDHVHLLRPIGSVADLTGGRTPETVAAELASGGISPDAGLVAVDFYQTDPAISDDVSLELAQAYRQAGVQVRGIFAAELADNDFPRLPVIQNPGEWVVISAYRNEAHFRQRPAPSLDAAMRPNANVSLLLAPTLRSPLRW